MRVGPWVPVWARGRQGRFERQLDRLYAYALSLTGHPEEARDLVQTCALKAWSARRVPVDEPAYRSWLFRILRNAFLDEVRKRADERPRRGEPAGAVGEGWNSPGRVDVFSLEQSRINAFALRQGVDGLRPDYREVVTLVDMAGFSYQETADLLQIPVGTVMSRLSRARRQLLRLLAAEPVPALRLVGGKSAP